MGCGCNKGTTPTEFVYTAPDGTKKVYTSQVQAQAAVIKFGGEWKPKNA